MSNIRERGWTSLRSAILLFGKSQHGFAILIWCGKSQHGFAILIWYGKSQHGFAILIWCGKSQHGFAILISGWTSLRSAIILFGKSQHEIKKPQRLFQEQPLFFYTLFAPFKQA
jgi:hypothetical protein